MAEGRSFYQNNSDDIDVEVSIYVNAKADGATVDESLLDSLLATTAQTAASKAVTQPKPAPAPAPEAKPTA